MQNKLLLKTALLLGVCFLPLSNPNAQEVEVDIEEEEIIFEPQIEYVKPALIGTKGVHPRRRFDKARHELAKKESLEEKYANFKKALNGKMGLSYTFDMSVLGQRGAPNGEKTAWQTQYYGSANWNMYSSPIGTGSLQAAYTYVHYWGQSAETVGNNIGVINDINDYSNNSYYFDQLSYTHQFPGVLSPLSVTVGQFPMYNFDGSAYDANQQINFVNFALSQNASSAYPTASLGGYITLAPNDEWSFSVGMQDANNISGSQIETSTFHRKQYTSFASVSYTPTIEGMGEGQYSIMLYNQPWTINQPETSNGWSINLSQALNNKFTVFGRINGNTGNSETISQSYVLGGVVNNPFNRNALDQFGFATAINKVNKEATGATARSVETVLEGYFSLGVSNFLILTPDVQFYINPAENTDNKHNATVVSMRATLMF